jgi:hypothetical protein
MQEFPVSKSRMYSDELRRDGFTWDDYSGAIGAWVRHEADGTVTKVGRVGRKYIAVSMTSGETVVPVVYREAVGKTRRSALDALASPAAAALADELYRNGPRIV